MKKKKSSWYKKYKEESDLLSYMLDYVTFNLHPIIDKSRKDDGEGYRFDLNFTLPKKWKLITASTSALNSRIWTLHFLRDIDFIDKKHNKIKVFNLVELIESTENTQKS